MPSNILFQVRIFPLLDIARCSPNRLIDYALPPNEDKTEILRVVVRESMTLDLLGRLITDIYQVTETLMNSESAELWGIHATAPNSIEKQHGSKGHEHKNRDKAQRPMSKGIHRSVC